MKNLFSVIIPSIVYLIFFSLPAHAASQAGVESVAKKPAYDMEKADVKLIFIGGNLFQKDNPYLRFGCYSVLGKFADGDLEVATSKNQVVVHVKVKGDFIDFGPYGYLKIDSATFDDINQQFNAMVREEENTPYFYSRATNWAIYKGSEDEAYFFAFRGYQKIIQSVFSVDQKGWFSSFYMVMGSDMPLGIVSFRGLTKEEASLFDPLEGLIKNFGSTSYNWEGAKPRPIVLKFSQAVETSHFQS